MARKKTAQATPSQWPVQVAAAGFFLAEIAVLRGAASPFRLPKEAVALAALSLAVGLAVFAAARRGGFTWPGGRVVVVLLALPALQAASALWSASPIRALESAALSTIWVAGIGWLATLDSRSRRRLATAAAIGVAFSSAVMMLQIVGVRVFNLGQGFTSGRLSLTGLTGNPADLAMAAVLLLPLIMLGTERPTQTRLQIALVLVLTLATLLTMTLSGIGALAALLIVWLFQRRSRKLWLSAAAVGAVFLAAALAAGLGSRFISASQRVQEGDWYRLLSARGDGWSAASEMVRSRPLTGVGAANYDHLYYPSRLAWFERYGGVGKRRQLASHFSSAHSDPFQLAAELGAIGLGWLAALLAALIGARRRAGPTFALATASVLPFALLHYPTHLAVGLIPIAVILGELIGTTGPRREVEWRRARAPVAVTMLVIALVGAGWQLRRTAADLWMGTLDMVLLTSQGAAPEARAQRAAAVEAAILQRIDHMPRQAPTLWRTVGRARFMRQDLRDAEAAFRTAYEGWPHEDADFYLGLSLVAQGRRSEGVRHLGRVCRTNPTLVRLIRDADVRRAVEDMLDAYRAR